MTKFRGDNGDEWMNVNIYTTIAFWLDSLRKNVTVALKDISLRGAFFYFFSLHSSITCVHVHLMCVKLTEEGMRRKKSNFLKDKY